MAYKPDGHPSVSAHVMADGAQRVIDFLVKAFDAVPLRRHDHADGSVMHAAAPVSAASPPAAECRPRR